MSHTGNRPILPLALRAGSRIRIVAPAGPVPAESLWSGVNLLESKFGFVVEVDPQVFEKDRYFAGSDHIRLDVLQNALLDRRIDGVFCARGGYGTVRIAPMVHDLLKVHSRIPTLVGFSDITALHAAFIHSHHVSFHGPVVTQLERLTEESLTQTRALLAGNPQSSHLGGPWMRCLRPGIAVGMVYSGNLSLIASLVGTKLAFPLRSAIVVFEDVGEPAYRIDRMIQQLLLGGLTEAAAIVIGQFSGIDEYQATLLDLLWNELAEQVKCPVITNAPIGHETHNITLPQGVRARIDTQNQRFDLIDPWVVTSA